jgi:5-methylcytosine-specific restriction endonuclease McrA
MSKEHKKEIREKFRNAVFKRDRNKCVFCDSTTDLDAHHITDRHEMPNGGYVLSNGITLCPTHHLLAEEYHVNGYATTLEFSPTELYKKIHSSKEQAIQDGERNENILVNLH